MLDPEELDDSEVDKAIEEIATEVVKRRLEAPAILFIEMNRPLSFVGSQALIVATPLFGPLFGPDKMARFSKLLSRQENVDKLITRIEEKSNERDRKDKPEDKTEEESQP